MAFVMFLTCLFHVKVFDMKSDLQAVGLVVFDKYMNLVRKLQTTYRMEPAGSQGGSLATKIMVLSRSYVKSFELSIY